MKLVAVAVFYLFVASAYSKATMEPIFSGQLTGKAYPITIHDNLEESLVLLYDPIISVTHVIGFGVATSHAIIYTYSQILKYCKSPTIKFFNTSHMEPTTYSDQYDSIVRLSWNEIESNEAHEMLRYAKISTKNLEEGMPGVSVSFNRHMDNFVRTPVCIFLRSDMYVYAYPGNGTNIEIGDLGDLLFIDNEFVGILSAWKIPTERRGERGRILTKYRYAGSAVGNFELIYDSGIYDRKD